MLDYSQSSFNLIFDMSELQIIENWREQAGAELDHAQLKLGLDFNSINLY